MQELTNQLVNKESFPTHPLHSQHSTSSLPPSPTPPSTAPFPPSAPHPQGMSSHPQAAIQGQARKSQAEEHSKEMQVAYTQLEAFLFKCDND